MPFLVDFLHTNPDLVKSSLDYIISTIFTHMYSVCITELVFMFIQRIIKAYVVANSVFTIITTNLF